MKNKSAAYGYYGGVTKSQHYIPPGSPNYVPQPSLATNFTQEDRDKITQLINQTVFYAENAPNILLRKVISSLPGNIDSFVLSTSAKPEDVITYTSHTDEVDLNKVDGGYF